MKKFSFITLLIIAMLAVTGCGNNSDKLDDAANGNQEEVNNNLEEASKNNEETETDSKKDDSEGNPEKMKLGETALIDRKEFKIEITPTSVEIIELGDDSTLSNNDVLVRIDYTIKNVYDNGMSGHEVLGGILHLENEENFKNGGFSNRGDTLDHANYEHLSIEPGESYDAQLGYILPELDEYILHYDAGSGPFENADWRFTKDDAK